ncbi:MAG TPA: protein kinase [Dongiaceae bacterium]|nr:protein kinase [Dongiaceae bacterium]
MINAVIHRVRRPTPRIGVGSVLKQRYQLVQRLGAGGMGTVYKARDLWQPDLNGQPSWVALKILPAQQKAMQQEHALVSLHQETRKTRRLVHPNIVNVHEFVCAGGTAFMVMEWLEGESLDILLRRHPDGLPLAQALDLINQLARAIGYAHRQGIVHADLKPANIFLTTDGCLKVLDFGIARALQDDALLDHQGSTALTPTYASLHMLNGGRPRPVDDLYGLGCIAYLLLSGRHPFNRHRATEAEATGLKPSRILTISPPQWRALERLLQFRPRGDLSLQQFHTVFFADKTKQRGWIWAVLLLMLLGLLGALSLGEPERRHLGQRFSNPVPTVLTGLHFVSTQQLSRLAIQRFLQTPWAQLPQLAAVQTGRRVDTCTLRLANQGKQKGARCRDGLDDGRLGPELVVIKVEGLAPFALSRTEISRADLNEYCRQTRRCGLAPEPTLPVVNLAPEQIQHYANWLSSQTGFRYRLPQMEEWLAVARDDSGLADHNCRLLSGGRLVRGQQLRSVEEGYANSLGLLNLFGNAEEWVQDGSDVVGVGGSHQTDMGQCNAAFRNKSSDGVQGFRLVRELNP